MRKKILFLLVLTELNELPADRKALPLAFLPPSARALALSIGWTMERAWFAGNMSFTFKHFDCFKLNSSHHILCSAASHTC